MAEGRLIRWIAPALVGAAGLLAWHAVVVIGDMPPWLLPGPGLVAERLVSDRAVLLPAWWVTMRITLLALALAAVGGVALALAFTASRWLELSLFPYAVALQVTPIISIAPLIVVYVTDPFAVLLLCAWIVAFFPVLSNTVLGLRSVDRGLVDLFRLYGASRWAILWRLRLPSALPYFLGGLRIAGGLALIGAVVAEFAAGTAGTASGLAYLILEAGYRLDIPRMFAALVLLLVTGIAIYAVITLITRLALRRWHESALEG